MTDTVPPHGTTSIRRPSPKSIMGLIAMLMTVSIAMIALDCAQYLHWSMPVFASRGDMTTAGTTVEHARGPAYEVTGLRTAHDRYMDITPIWEMDTDCSNHPMKILRATKAAVFHRHSVSLIGYDDGIEGIWVADCVPDGDDTFVVYAIAVERNEYGLHADTVSPERVTLKRRDGDYTVIAYDDATDTGRGFRLSKENGGFPFPRYVLDMYDTMGAMLRDSQENQS